LAWLAKLPHKKIRRGACRWFLVAFLLFSTYFRLSKEFSIRFPQKFDELFIKACSQKPSHGRNAIT
jgi:hypothetical protein